MTAAALAYGAPGLSLAAPWLRPVLGIEDRIEEALGVALTFDDGPHPQGTPAVLAALAAHGAHATFFLVGEQVALRPDLAREVCDAGHEAGLHCHRHRTALRLTPAQARDDLDRGAEAIAEATGRPPRLYRPAYGRMTAVTLTLARRRGWRPILWTRDPQDWRPGSTPEQIAGACRDLQAGEVVLLHDSDAYGSPGSWERTGAALPRILSELEAHALATAPI